jgi:hypothetical protein
MPQRDANGDGPASARHVLIALMGAGAENPDERAGQVMENRSSELGDVIPPDLDSLAPALAAPLRALAGGVDAHVHTGPFINETTMLWDAFELARAAGEIGLRAVVVKSYFGSSCMTAALANRYAGGASVVGGVTLNWATGGINPDAVRVAAHEGAYGGFRPGRVVWMPERSSLHRARMLRLPDQERYLSPFPCGEVDRGLTAEAAAVCEVIAEEDLVLATSHLSPEEGLALIELAKGYGVKRFVITHASNTAVAYTLDQKRRAAALGALIEEAAVVWEPGMELFHYAPIDAHAEIFHAMREIGPEHYILASDCGMGVVSKPTEALRTFAALLLAVGFTEQEVRTMAVTNPTSLLRLDEPDERPAATRDSLVN